MKTRYRIGKGKRLVVLTGAGVSAESGISTFRDVNGLWNNYKIEEVANYGAFLNQPEIVWQFYRLRYEQLASVKPNAAHLALAKAEKLMGERFRLITQNVDGLHGRAGSRNIWEMHGSLLRSFCSRCGEEVLTENLDLSEPVPKCGKCGGNMRPDIVWFGEQPYYLNEISAAVDNCDFLLIVGTSGVVYPAAALAGLAKDAGAVILGVNLETPENMRNITEFHLGKAGDILPELLEELLGEEK